nr:transcription initiation factor TFIID subunit 1-like isoform X4 [Osmia lignaria]
MPQIPKHRKIKRVTVLTKKTQFLRNYLKLKSYNPLCEKLRSNNYSLAKALSKEKEKTQLLFSQNVALVAEVQDLGSACSKSSAVISNVLKNAKDMLTMIVTMTGYLTNTISTCQEFVASSPANLRMSSNSTGTASILGDGSRRLSPKAPTKGVVKPMVSGHTITKPTINLSRVNMQHINNSSSLSIIQEVTSPPGNRESNSPRSSGHVTMRQHRNEDARVYRMPERLKVASPRLSDESERRLSKRSNRRSGRISGRLSGSLSKSRKLSLTENRNSERNETLENNVSVNLEDSQTNSETPESSPDNSKNNSNKTIGNENEEIGKNKDGTSKTQENISRTLITSNLEDPLEGPSWLYNNSSSVPSIKYNIQHTFHSFGNKDKKTDEVNISNNDSMDTTLKATELSDPSDNENSMQETSRLSITNKRERYNLKKDKEINNRNEYQVVQRNINNDTFDNTISTDLTFTNEDEYKVENEAAENFSNFVTQRRVCLRDEDEDDFTLMYMRQPNMNFDISDLKLPVLEQSALKPIVLVEPEPEITTSIKLIPQIGPLPSASNDSLNESIFDRSTVKLPVLNDNENKKKKMMKVKNRTSRESSEFVESTPPGDGKSTRKKTNKSVNKDPSAAKVVLQKLNEYDVKSRTPSPEVSLSQDSTKSLSPYSRMENSSDSENSNTSINSMYALNRPRRKRAPTVFHEPNLKAKLRRN